MFWGSMSGKYSKGAGLFWEKEWKTITAESYCEHTFPVIWNYFYNSIDPHPGLKFQQDRGSGHKAAYTLAYMKDRGVVPVMHCPFSPDLSPIEAL